MTHAEFRAFFDPFVLVFTGALVIMAVCAYFLQHGCPPEDD